MNPAMETQEPRTSWAEVRREPVVFLATGGWIGFLPVAPGTAGALLGVGLGWSIGQIPLVWLQALVVAALCGLGVPICTTASRKLKEKDPGCIVYDEISSVPIALFLTPVGSLSVLAAGFVLHRIFDITKPPPARRFERLPEGLGIQADDWVAGLYSNAVLQMLLAAGALPVGH